MKTKIKNKGFTIIELIVVMAIIGVFVLLAIPKFMGYTEKAKATEIKSNTKQLENASERYYIDKNDWPRLMDVPYTSSQITTFAQEITDKTGQVVTLDITGSYYDIDYTKIQAYVQKPKDNTHYVIQNPVGEVYYLKNLTTLGESTLSNIPLPNNKPTAVITMTPGTSITTATDITWSYASSTDIDGDTIINAEWRNKQNSYTTAGSYTTELRVQDSKGLWSEWTSNTFNVSTFVATDVIWTTGSGLPIPTATDIDTDKTNDISSVSNMLWHWSNILSWTQQKYTPDNSCGVMRGYYIRYFNATPSFNPSYGWRPILEVSNTDPLITGKNSGDIVKLGTVYMNNAKVLNPSNPIIGGNVTTYAGGNIEIRDTDTDDAYKIRWVYVKDGGKNLLIADRNLIMNVSWDTLDSQSLVIGKNILVNSGSYNVRLMTGGQVATNGSVGNFMASATNEWDRIISGAYPLLP